MDFQLTPEQVVLRKEFVDFFEAEMKHAPEGWIGGEEEVIATDEGWAFHKEMARKLGERGWIALAWPKEYGGQERPIMDQFMFNEVRGYYRSPGIDVFGVSMLAPTLLAAGTEEQKKEHLPYIARGERAWCQGWSEPDAGSDLANLSTRAIKEGDEYVLNGQKTWTTGAHYADWCFAVVRTDTASKRSRGLSFLLIDMKSPGITIRPLPNMVGEHMFNEVYFDNVRVPVKNRIGPENQGWAVTRAAMNFERSSAEFFAGSKRLVEEVVEFCKETKRDGEPLSKNPVVRHKLAAMVTKATVGLTWARQVAWIQHKGGLAVAEASAAKVFGSESGQQLTYMGCQLLGTHAQLKRGSHWAPLHGSLETEYQRCVGLNFGGGTSEIQRNVIAWEGLKLPRG